VEVIERLSRVECAHGPRLLPSTLTSPDQDTFAWDDAVAGDLTVKLHRLAIGLEALAGGAAELPALERVLFIVEDARIGEIFWSLARIPDPGLIGDTASIIKHGLLW